MANQRSGGTLEFVKTIVYAVCIALVVRTFFFEPFNIPSGSMKDTLLIGDYLFVNKMAYGYSKHSFPWSGFDLFNGRFFSDPVERGDVVVFKVPTDNETDYIKRIVGLPGDRIQVIGGVLHINGTPVPRERIEDFVDPADGRYVRYLETLPNGVRHHILERSDTHDFDNTEEFLVPEGHYFGMGDNRDNSRDSRAWKYIPEENLVGRASFIFFSTASEDPLYMLWTIIPNIRGSRIFTGIH